MKETVLESLAKFQRQGSNWRFRSVLSLHLYTEKYEPLSGSSYIPLPAFLAGKKRLSILKMRMKSVSNGDHTKALHPVEKISERIDIKLRENVRFSNGRD